LIFVNKNWPKDPRIGCKSSSNLVDLIEGNLNLEKEIEKFEKAFERDKVVELSKNLGSNFFFPQRASAQMRDFWGQGEDGSWDTFLCNLPPLS
jgi:hypothetical protein